MPHRYSTAAHWDLAAIRPLSPDLNGHPTLRLWSHVLLTMAIGDQRAPSGTDWSGVAALRIRAWSTTRGW